MRTPMMNLHNGTGVAPTLLRTVITIGLFIAAPIAMGQAVSASSLAAVCPDSQGFECKAKRAPLPHLYWHFLMYQNHLDRDAAEREKQGKDGSWLRDHFQKKLGFTDSQFGNVRESALHLETQLKTIGAQAKLIAQSDREWRHLHGAAAHATSPGKSQLHELWQQHEEAITNEVQQMNQKLGPQASATLQNFIETDWARHVTIRNVRPRPHTSGKRPPVNPFATVQPEVQQ